MSLPGTLFALHCNSQEGQEFFHMFISLEKFFPPVNYLRILSLEYSTVYSLVKTICLLIYPMSFMVNIFSSRVCHLCLITVLLDIQNF